MHIYTYIIKVWIYNIIIIIIIIIIYKFTSELEGRRGSNGES